MTQALLPRGTRTPPGHLVFVPIDGRPITALLPEHVRTLVAGLDQERRAAPWILVPCLVALRGEFNALSPNRDKASDGSIGDTAHAAESSDHNPDETGATPYEDSDNINEVHAIDVDSSGPWPPGITFQMILDHIVAEHRAGRDDRLQNIIYRGRIISRSWGWDSWHVYTGASPHNEHGHLSARYSTAQESDTSPWGVATIGDDMTPEELRLAVVGGIADALHQASAAATDPNATGVTPTGRQMKNNLHNLISRSPTGLTAAAILTAANGILTNVVADDGDLAAIKAEIQQAATDILSGLAETGQTNQELAALLAAALGDRAAAVGAIMSGGAPA